MAMSQFSAARQEGILAEAAANLRRRDQSSLDLVVKTRDDARVPPGDADDGAVRARSERSVSVASGSSELSWWEWTERFVDARLEAHGESIGTVIGEFCGQQIAPLKREIELLRREVIQLREQVGLERELKELRGQIETAKNQVPKVPELVSGLKQDQTRLQREVARTKEKVSKLRTNQSISDYRLAELSKTAKARAASLEMKIETTVSSFKMREIDPSAARALRAFASESLKNTQHEKIWIFPDPEAGSA